MINIFVYGTLKPGESNYHRYCADKVLSAKRAIAFGKLFALPFGYPAMTLGASPVQGFLLSFADSSVLRHLDLLEDYDLNRPPDQNEYNRQLIETYDLAFTSLGRASVYLMTLKQVHSLGGLLIADGWWSGFGLSPNDYIEGYKRN